MSEEVSMRLVPIRRLLVPFEADPDMESKLPVPAIVTAPVDWRIDPKFIEIVP